MRKAILRNGSPGCSQPIETKYGMSAQKTRPEVMAGMPMRAPTSMPAPQRRSGELDGAEEGDLARRDAADDARRDAAAELADRLAQQHRVGERAQDVGHREPGGVGELHPVHEHRRVEHADADAEHADAEHVEDELPDRRLRQPHPHHRLDEHAHAAHAGHRGRRRLHVVGAVLAFGAVAEGDGRAEDAREHLPAHEEAQREIHVGGGDAAQRAQHEDAEADEEGVVLPGARGGKPGPARGRSGRARRSRSWGRFSGEGAPDISPSRRAATSAPARAAGCTARKGRFPRRRRAGRGARRRGTEGSTGRLDEKPEAQQRRRSWRCRTRIAGNEKSSSSDRVRNANACFALSQT